MPFKTCHFAQESSVLLARREFGTRLGWVQTLFSPLPALSPLRSSVKWERLCPPCRFPRKTELKCPAHNNLLKKLFSLYWSIADCGGFRWIAKGTQPYISMYPFSPKLPSHPDCHITLSRVPCNTLILICVLTHWLIGMVRSQAINRQ